jgi:hypothetical protein
MSDPDDGRAPICPFCGVTALPGDARFVIDTRFVCENPDCEVYGEVIGSPSWSHRNSGPLTAE